jgi:hypothetical protein
MTDVTVWRDAEGRRHWIDAAGWCNDHKHRLRVDPEAKDIEHRWVEHEHQWTRYGE